MKILSWNVNGLRSALGKGFTGFVAAHEPDVLCVQETKSAAEDIAIDLPGYQTFWNHAERKGYSGTATFLRQEPLDVRKGIGVAKHDSEGRVLTCELPDLFVVNVYVPNSKRDLARLPYRCDEWDVDFLKYVRKLDKKKPVVFCGDLNVAHTEIDLTHPKANVKNHGFTPEERDGFEKLLKGGFIDSFREHQKEGGHYTWWSQMGNCRARNIGWRIDYVMVSKQLAPRLTNAFILPDVTGSDHCPVGVELL
jgi:exodeoxyribonuclease-3